jgi:hypothetical protein
MDKSKPASTTTDGINSDPPPHPIFNPEDLIGRSLWTNKKMVNNSKDALSNSLKIMSPRWKKPPPGSSSEFLSMRTKLKKSSLTAIYHG